MLSVVEKLEVFVYFVFRVGDREGVFEFDLEFLLYE